MAGQALIDLFPWPRAQHFWCLPIDLENNTFGNSFREKIVKIKAGTNSGDVAHIGVKNFQVCANCKSPMTLLYLRPATSSRAKFQSCLANIASTKDEISQVEPLE